MTKLFFLIAFLLVINKFATAQISILFDASKAETANNSDWIVDADTYNLGYNPTAYIGGHEANAQRIPTPAQSGITSSTSQNYWAGALSAWAVDAAKLGYHIETLPYNGLITYGDATNPQDLSNYTVYVVCEPNILFSASEKVAIINFVQNGGGLFIISDHNNSDRNGDGHDSPDIWNDLMQNNSIQVNPFGITFDYEFFSDNTTNIPNLPNNPLLHGSYGSVTSVEFYGGTSMTLDTAANATVKGVVYRSGFDNSKNLGVLCAYSKFGSGKIVALGDSSPADDGTGDPNDHLYDGWLLDANGNHERLIMNATVWLANPTTSISKVDFRKDIKVSTGNNTFSIMINTKNIATDFQLDLYDMMGRKIIKRNHIAVNQVNHFFIDKDGVFLYVISEKGRIYSRGKLLIK